MQFSKLPIIVVNLYFAAIFDIMMRRCNLLNSRERTHVNLSFLNLCAPSSAPTALNIISDFLIIWIFTTWMPSKIHNCPKNLLKFQKKIKFTWSLTSVTSPFWRQSTSSGTDSFPTRKFIIKTVFRRFFRDGRRPRRRRYSVGVWIFKYLKFILNFEIPSS